MGWFGNIIKGIAAAPVPWIALKSCCGIWVLASKKATIRMKW